MSDLIEDSNIHIVDIVTAEINTEEGFKSDEKAIEEDKKSKIPKKIVSMLDARRRIEVIVEAKKRVQLLDYLYHTEDK